MNTKINTGELMLEKIKQLVEELKKYNEEYYTNGSPSISDEDYDLKKMVVKDYIDAYPEHEDLAKDVLSNVGSPTFKKGFQKAKHSSVMLSLDSVYDVNGFQKWVNYCNAICNIERYNFTIQPKLDGLGIELIYNYGEFKQAITRGNGIEGEDVTENILATKEVPLTVPAWNLSHTISVVGEVAINKSDFDKYLAKDFANPRNAAVGSLKQLDSSVIPQRYLRVYCFNYIDARKDDWYLNRRNFKEKMIGLEDYGFRVVPFNLSATLQEIPKIFKNMILWRPTYDVEMDGIVIKVDDLSMRNQLGRKSNCPVGEVAWKFNSMVGSSKLLDVKWSMSKNGTLTPVAKIEPIGLGGVTITNVNLHNIDLAINMLDLKIGDVVDIRRAGDVIPEIIGVDKNQRLNNTVTDIQIPLKCPYCGSATNRKGLELVCMNTDQKCKEQIILRLAHFTSKEAIDVEGLSIETIRVFVEQFNVTTPSELYNFDFNKLNGVVGFGEKKINNLKQALQKSLNTDMASFIYALGISEVGKSTAKQLAEGLKGNTANLPNLTERTISAMNLKNVGKVTAKKIGSWFTTNGRQEIQNLMVLFNFLATTKVKPTATKNNNLPLSGESILFTGTLNLLNKTRRGAQKIVEELGGICATSVSNASILVTGDKPGSKYNDAITKGIRIMDQSEFKKIVDVCLP